MTTTNLVTEGTHQFVRLPKEFEFIGINQVEIRRKGKSIIITPLRKSWKSWKSWKSFASLPEAGEDFLIDRPDVLQTDRDIF
jgi:antitoxin VapB